MMMSSSLRVGGTGSGTASSRPVVYRKGYSMYQRVQFPENYVRSNGPLPTTTTTGSSNKKTSTAAMRMPNLLKTIKKRGAKNKKGTNPTINSSINTFRIPGSTNTTPLKPGIPENVFLKKYDPIRLLRRARCKSPTKAPSSAIMSLLPSKKAKKIVVCRDLPRKRRRVQSVKPNREFGSKKKKKRRKDKPRTEPPTIFSWSTSSYGIQFCQPAKAPVVAKPKPKKRVRVPRYETPKRKVNVKYRPATECVYGPLSYNKLRVIAAVYLKRALRRVRSGNKVKRSTIRKRLKKMKERKKRKVTAADAKKTDKKTARKPPSSKFSIAKAKIAPPVKIRARPVPMLEPPSHMRTIRLLQHKRDLQDQLESYDSTAASNGTAKLDPIPPKCEEESRIPFVYKNTMLKKREAKHVITQKLLINLATVGFTHTKVRPLEVMADASSNFFAKMAQRLKEVAEMEMHGADHGFPDAMERVLIEQGLGGIRGLQQFYRTKVVDYSNRMEDQCVLLRRQYGYKVRSKVGMSNVNTNSNVSATSSCSNPSVTNNTSASSSSTISNIKNNATFASPSVMVVSGGGIGGTNSAASAAVASKSTIMAKTSSSSSQPLSPGNSVLAEMLTHQEDFSVKTPQGCPSSPSLGMMMMGSSNAERQLEDLMGAPPPNVEIRPNSFPQPHHPLHRQSSLVHQQLQQPQQIPLHQLYPSLSQQHNPSTSSQQRSQQQQQQQSLLPPPSPQQQQALNPYANSLYGSSPPLTPSTPSQQQLSQKVYPPQPSPLQGSSQGAPAAPSQQQQSHLTQLLQRPISNQPISNLNVNPPATTTGHHLILHHHHPQPATPPQQANQYQHQLQHHALLTSPNQQQNQIKTQGLNPALIMNNNSMKGTSQVQQGGHLANHPIQAAVPTPVQGTRQLVSGQLQLNMSKPHVQLSSLASGETTYSSNITTTSMPLTRTVTNTNGAQSPSNSNLQGGSKFITIIRSSSATGAPQQHGIILNNTTNHHHGYMDGSMGTLGIQDNVISINFGGQNEVEGGGDVGVGMSAAPSTTPSPKAKLKEAISQRNLLRLNFEQVPSGAGDSTVLLSSSSVAQQQQMANTAGVQFIGKVSGPGVGAGQTVCWNNTPNYS